MEVSHFKVSTHIFKKYHRICSYNFYIIDGHLWSLQCSIKMDAEFLHHIYLPKVDRSLILKFQLNQKVPFLDAAVLE